MRDKQALRMTSRYTHEEQRIFKSFEVAPTPRAETWKSYIEFSLKTLPNRLATYTTRKYSQLELHKYIETNRATDNVANLMTAKRKAAVFLGDAKFPADSPIGLKRQKRSPGERKLEVSLKKSGKVDVLYVPEAYTSQTCPHCKRRFPKSTKSHRYKVCVHCPGEPIATKIITNRSQRRRQREKRMAKGPTVELESRAERSKRHREERRARFVYPNDTEKRRKRRERRRELRQRRVVQGRRHIARHRERAKKGGGRYQEEETATRRRYGVARVSNEPRPEPNNSGAGKLGSKRILFEKTCHLNPVNGPFGHANEMPQQQQQQPSARTIVFHRDIAAALCILYVGEYTKNRLFVVVVAFKFQLFVVSGRCLVFGLEKHGSFKLDPKRITPSIRAKQPKPTCRGETVASDAQRE